MTLDIFTTVLMLMIIVGATFSPFIHRYSSTASVDGWGITFHKNWMVTFHFGDRRVHWFWSL